jgi:uncharacterized protein YprB with RNaseH-like and TPR domain
MLTHTFQHLSGIGKAADAKLKKAGLRSWDDALKTGKLPLTAKNCSTFIAGLEESYMRLETGDALWFSERLPAAEQWRLYPHFFAKAAYVDIETTGIVWPRAWITSIALYDGTDLKVYVRGRNLDDFIADIGEYALLVTWNGRAFDVPFLRRSFNITLKMAHLDLYPVFRSLGIRGGLKQVEKRLGMERGELEGVDGYMAVLLWHEYLRSGDESAVETLLAYNAEDVFSLEILCRHVCEQKGIVLPRACSNPVNPYTANVRLLDRLKKYTPGWPPS